ncbi:TPA: hypothetical protein ACT4GU_002103 [Escherichia coli]
MAAIIVMAVLYLKNHS